MDSREEINTLNMKYRALQQQQSPFPRCERNVDYRYDRGSNLLSKKLQ